MEKGKQRLDSNDYELIRMSAVSKTIARNPVLRNVNMEVLAGTALAVCGANGAGKTTLIRILLGLLKPDSGSLRSTMHMGNTSFLFHSPCIFPELTLKQNCRFFLNAKGKSLNEGEFSALQVEFGLEREKNDRVGTFSRGMLQKADLVRALIEKPQIMFLDEPTSHLDPLGKILVRDNLRSRVDAGMTLVVTSHLLGEVEKLVDYVCILDGGEIAWKGNVCEDLNGMDLESRFVEIVAEGQGRANDKAN